MREEAGVGSVRDGICVDPPCSLQSKPLLCGPS